MPKIPIYPSRYHFMENELVEFMEKAQNIKILNIAFTCIVKLENSKDFIKNKIAKDNAVFEILIIKRKRKKDDFSYLKLREDDEKSGELRKNMNSVLFELFIFMLEDLYSLPKEGCEKKHQCHYNIKIMEYPFCPVMTMYIFDDKDLIFGPYISTNCNSIPMFHLKKRIFQQEISKAYNQLNTHYSILSNPNRRRDKKYIDKFCYFNGSHNISIHEFIDNNVPILTRYLNSEIKTRYEQYLTNEDNKEFHDKYIMDLGDEELEGRFDAVMRHIENEIQKMKISMTTLPLGTATLINYEHICK